MSLWDRSLATILVVLFHVATVTPSEQVPPGIFNRARLAFDSTSCGQPLRLLGGRIKHSTFSSNLACQQIGKDTVLIADAEAEEEAADTVCRTIDINARPEECFAVATGYEDYPKWAGNIDSVEIVERRPDGLASLVDFKMGLFGISVKNLFKYQYQIPERMDWTVIRGSVKKLVGSYAFEETGPENTRVTYNLMVDPGFPLPGPVRRATARAICNAALKELKKYTESPETLARLRNGNSAARRGGNRRTEAEETLLFS